MFSVKNTAPDDGAPLYDEENDERHYQNLIDATDDMEERERLCDEYYRMLKLRQTNSLHLIIWDPRTKEKPEMVLSMN